MKLTKHANISESDPETIFPANGIVGIFEDNQKSAGKTQLTPANVETRDGFPPKKICHRNLFRLWFRSQGAIRKPTSVQKRIMKQNLYS
jgi:hypothetical protein